MPRKAIKYYWARANDLDRYPYSDISGKYATRKGAEDYAKSMTKAWHDGRKYTICWDETLEYD